MSKKVVSVNDKVPFLHGKLIEAKGIVPSGNIDITSTQQVDVTNYATAQVFDTDLVAENIKKGVNILGVDGSFEGGAIIYTSTRFIMYTENMVLPDQDNEVAFPWGMGNGTSSPFSCMEHLKHLYVGKNIVFNTGGGGTNGYGMFKAVNGIYTGLETLEIHSKNIGYDQYLDCTSLKEVEIGEECLDIYGWAFENCRAIEKVTIYGDRVITLNNTNAFSNSPNAQFYVPSNLLDTYKSATNWSTYASRIYAITEV